MSSKPSVICHLSDFTARPQTSFVDALLCLALHCRHRLGTESFCIFPEDAEGRSWLKRFQDHGILHGFIRPDGTGFLRIRRLLERYEPLVFHSHFVSYDISTIILKLLVYRQSKVVWHQHSVSGLTLRQRAKDIVKVVVLGRLFVDRFIASGEGAFDNARARGFSNEKLILIQNGIEVSRFQPENATRRRVRESLGVGRDHVVYLLLGRDPHTKGVDLFVKAASHASGTANSHNLFLIIGETETRRFAMDLPESRRLGSALRIIDPVEDFPSLLTAVDVVVSASRHEGFGCTIAEAMAAGKLILLSDIPGARETFGGSRGVWLFPAEDWMMQATCMKKAGQLSTSERQILGAANSRYAAEHYSLERWAEQIGQMYEGLLT